MNVLRHHMLLLWAVRNLTRHPGRHLLLFAAVLLLVTINSALLLFHQAVTETTLSLIGERPALVVRRLTPGGWAPMPEAQALNSVSHIPGVLNPRPRIWGTVQGPQGPVTVFADMGFDTGALPGSAAPPQPGPGEVWIGGGITDTDVKGPLQLSGYRSLQFKIAGEFDRDTDMATHGLVLLSPGDARRLLDIPPGHVSDLAIDVFHAAEAEAILPELETAFPWPVQITTRQSAVKFYTAFFARKSGVWALVLVPTILALVLLTAALFEGQVRFSSEMGLLKALGWTSADIARYHFYRTGAIGLTAAVAGGALAYGLVFYPGVTWPHHLLLFNSPYVPGLYLNASGVAGVILEIAALVVAPFLVAAYWASLKGVGADPADLLEAGQSS
jgi:hypothetical protein